MASIRHQPSAHQVRGLVDEDRSRNRFRVHRSTLTDPDILALERERIFDRCWLYLGHESELAGPGAFISRSFNHRPLIFVRDATGRIRCFYNVCPHRGSLVCREPKGVSKSFQCAYHGWTFSNGGKLIGQPGKDAYPEGFNADGEYDLPEVPRLESCHGFVFVNFDAAAESLDDYLADAKPYLELIALQSAIGMEIVGGTQEYSARANWKLLLENSADGYHAPTAHASYFDYLADRDGAAFKDKKFSYNKAFGQVLNLGNGHAVSESQGAIPWGRPVARWVPGWGEEARAGIAEIRRELEERLGPEKAEMVAERDYNLLIFPNLAVLNIMAVTVRTFYPVTPDYFEVRAWAMAPKGEAEAVKDRRLRNFLEFLGPGGFATPDDVEMLELCQQGYACQNGAAWNDLSKGMFREADYAAKQDELQMRTFWRRWRDMMGAEQRMSFREAV
ncbi:MAG: aromatic ring-hydroxylating dioxygenase subunit alpha [Sneathiellaceae bacterium]